MKDPQEWLLDHALNVGLGVAAIIVIVMLVMSRG